MSWQTILKVDSLLNVKPLRFKEGRPLEVFNLIVGVTQEKNLGVGRTGSTPVSKEGVPKPNEDGVQEGNIQSISLEEYLTNRIPRKDARQIMNLLKPIMELDEEDFNELHMEQPRFNYKRYKNVRRPAMPFFNELFNAVARPEGEKQDKISPNLLSAIEKFKAGDDSALMLMLEKGKKDFKTQLRQVIDDEFYAAAKQSENNERLVELLANVDSEFARKATAEKSDYEARSPIQPQDVINYLENAFKTSEIAFVAPSKKDELESPRIKRLFGGQGRARVTATLEAFINTENVDTFPVAVGSKAVGQNRIQSILQESDRETETADVEDVADFGSKALPTVLEDYRKSQFYGGRDTNVRNTLVTYRNKLLAKDKEDSVKHLDMIIEAGQYYLTEQEYGELDSGAKGYDIKENQLKDWALRRRFSHLLDGDELKKENMQMFQEIESDLVPFSRGRVTEREGGDRKEGKASSNFFVVDITGSMRELEGRLSRVKRLFSQSITDGVDNLLTDIDTRRSGETKMKFQTWFAGAIKESVGNTVSYAGLLALLTAIVRTYGGSDRIPITLKTYIDTQKESDEDNLETALKQDYPKLRELFFRYVSEAIEKIANLPDDHPKVKDNSSMQTFRGYVRGNLVN